MPPTPTELTCPICEQPIDGFADAMAHPSYDGKPTHFHCLERAAAAPSPLPAVESVIDVLHTLGMIEWIEDDEDGAQRVVLTEALAELYLAGFRQGSQERRDRVAEDLERGRWMELELRQRASVPGFIRNGRIGGGA